MGLACVEEANPGDPDVQAIFAGGVKGDFTFVTVAHAERPLNALLAEAPYQGVLGQGGRVLFDRAAPAAPARTLPERPVIGTARPPEQE